MIHRALKLIRQFHDLKQGELAEEFSISKSYLSEIEAGKKTVSYDLLEKYAQRFNIPVSSLVFIAESIENPQSAPEKFRGIFASKVISLMEWCVNKNESTEIKA